MANKIDKKATIGGILQIILTPLFIIVFGTIFSLITGYRANDQLIIVKVIVWMINLIGGWIISTSILKVIFKRKISFLSYKYMFFAYIVSVLLIWSIGMDESDYSYVTSALTIIGVAGAVWGIKLYKKEKGRPTIK
jgi:hypothetical protein